MKKLIGLLVAIVVGLALLPLIITSSADYNLGNRTDTFTAESADTVVETFTTEKDIETLSNVKVNGEILTLTTDYTVSGNIISLTDSASDTDDIVSVTYIYEMETSTGVGELVALLPILFTVILVVGIVVTIKIKN